MIRAMPERMRLDQALVQRGIAPSRERAQALILAGKVRVGGQRADRAAMPVGPATPVDLEETFGLTQGHIYHAELALDQIFSMRPVPGWARYRTPIENLFLCGSGTHPGGPVTGLPGYLAARQILKQWSKRS